MKAKLLILAIYMANFANSLPAAVQYENIYDKRHIESLQLLHVLFRHGARTPLENEIYPKDPYKNYTYPPLGYGKLTAKGVSDEYEIGKDLRRRYNEFLGHYNEIDVVARATDTSRSIMSCSLVMAGMYPPSGNDKLLNDLNWQPTVCTPVTMEKDYLLDDPHWTCPNFKKYYLENQASVKNSLDTKYGSLYEYLMINTGLTIKEPRDIYLFSFSLASQDALGLELPSWTKSIWPANITEAAVEEYYLYMGNTPLRRLSGGRLLKKIYDDTVLKILNENPDTNRTIYLYSGHENNIASQLLLMDIFQPHIPPFSSYIVYEVHKIDGVYAFKILYQDHTYQGKLKVLQLPGCSEFCPIDQFKQLVGFQFPTDEDICGNEGQCNSYDVQRNF